MTFQHSQQHPQGGFSMRSIAIALLAVAVCLTGFKVFSANAIPTGYYKDQKVVYHNDGSGPDNAAYFKRMLNSISKSAWSATAPALNCSRPPTPTRISPHGSMR